MVHQYKNSLLFKIIAVVLFILMLTGFRMLWNNFFQPEPDQPMVEAGKLDLQEWDFSEKGTVTMSGEWNFYPNMLVEDLENKELNASPITVPGDWSKHLNGEADSPYGYGTYHLRIYLDPSSDQRFRIHVPSVRSASKLYANGEHVGGSGVVGTKEKNTEAHNIPYTSSTIRSEGIRELDIYLEASNFIDPRESGLIRSIKIGLEEDIVKETNLSMILQVVAAIIFIVHALFAIIIYIIGIRERRLLYFSIMLIVLAFINTTFGDEKVLYQYVTLDYVYSLKGASLAMLILFLALIHVARKQIDRISPYIVPSLTFIYIMLIGTLLFLPIEYQDKFITAISVFVFVTFILALISLLKPSNEGSYSLAFTFSILAVFNHLFWFFYFMTTGIKVIHYPFDLIIAIICIVIVWFKEYYNLHRETVALSEELKIVDKAKDEFLANTSHELRNPLHSILNISDAVLQREESSIQRESADDLRTILNISKRMSVLVDELLDVASIEGGTPKLNYEAVCVRAVVSGVIDMIAYSIEGKPVTIKNKISDDLPMVYSDENRLIQVLFNLIHNAVKFTPEGEIVIDAKVIDEEVYISVADTGIGMSKQTLERIFERYAQGDNADMIGEGGFGIGLYVSKQLVELHGGTFTVDSKLGEGSVFTLSLPIAEKEEQVIKESILKEEIAATSQSNQEVEYLNQDSETDVETDKPRIIIVDDEKINLRVIETVLDSEPYEIKSVLSAKEVIELLDEREWDLVIADVMMPNMSGYELTREIRQRFSLSELPVLLVTARSSTKDIEAGFTAGANDYITKPIDAIELRSRVKALTSVKQSMRERLLIESAWLQAQIKPHFLFNTLNSIIALSQIDLERMTKMLNAFSDILRAKFDFENLNNLVLIDREISLIKSYCEIEQIRFGDRLKMTLDIEEGLNVMIPSLSIQPLVENAINHGVMNLGQGGEVLLRIKSFDHYVEITVADNGVGMDEETLQRVFSKRFTKKMGVGLINIHKRLQRLYGKGLKIETEVGKGTTVSFRIPK